MRRETRRALDTYLLAMADDELILGHRDSEWTGHAPILEEDIAFTNLALDELGHAQMWYGLLADLRAEDSATYPNELVFHREAPDFRNVQLVETPNGDWAHSMLRQYFFDAFESVHLALLDASEYQPLAAGAAKALSEERYHLRHTRAWVRRLGLGTDESHRRMQRALDALWGPVQQLFEPTEGHQRLVEEAIVPATADVREGWSQEVESMLAEADLEVPEGAGRTTPSRRQHSEQLVSLLTDLQYVARSHPGAAW
jgi:ring-1,2-phenylacetyl-CoA epoxidase subunit PaaC